MTLVSDESREGPRGRAAPERALTAPPTAGRPGRKRTRGCAARSMSSLLVSPAFHEDHTLFAAGIEDGILRSRDGGQTWEHANEGLPGPQILSLALSPRFGRGRHPARRAGRGPVPHRGRGPVLDHGRPRGADRSAHGVLLPGHVREPALRRPRLRAAGLPLGERRRDLAGAQSAPSRTRRSWPSPSPRPSTPTTPCCWPPSPPRGPCAASRERAPGARQPFREDAPQSAVTVWRSTDSGRRWAPVIEQITSARWVTFGFPSDYRGDQESARNGFFAGIGTLIQRPMWGGKQLWMAERVGRPNTAILALASRRAPSGAAPSSSAPRRRLPLRRRGPHLARAPRGSAQPHGGGRRPDAHLPRGRGRVRPHPGGCLAPPRPRVSRGGEPSG